MNYQVVMASVMAVLVGTAAASPVIAQSGQQAGQANRQAKPVPKDYEPDTLLIMPNSGADKNEIATALQEAHGNVVQTIGSGAMTTLVVQTESGQMEEVEKKLGKDSDHFSRLQRNFKGSGSFTINDPDYPSEWYISTLGLNTAWDKTTGRGQVIALCDSGCQGNNADLAGRTYSGLDYMNGSPGNRPATGNVDGHASSHGTCMATIAAATANNKKMTAGSSNAYIYPFKISKPTASGGVETTDDVMCAAIWECGSKGIRICSISYGVSDTSKSYANPKEHPVLHAWMKWYHDNMNGIVIFSAGNDGRYDPSEKVPYMIMCSGIDKKSKRASFSNYGKPIWFAGPAVDIACSNREGRVVQVSGTSCVPPMIAGIIALMLAKKPGLSNKTIEQALIKSCGGKAWDQEKGYGVPNASLALENASKDLGDEDELGAEATFAKLEGPSFVIEPVAEKDLRESSDPPGPPSGDKPTFQ